MQPSNEPNEGQPEDPGEQAVRSLEQLMAGLEEIGGALDDADLRPSAERGDWAAQRERVAVMKKRIDAVLLGPLEQAVGALSDEANNGLRNATAHTVAEYAALAHVAQAPGVDPLATLAEALTTSPDGPTLEELKLASEDIDSWAALVLGRWHLRHGGHDAAEAPLRAVLSAHPSDALGAAASAALATPRPLKRAPPLFTLNGCGTSMYGSREPGPDGSVVKTLCLALVFIPLLPLAAYRLVDHGEGSYSFLHKVPLSGFATWFRRLLLAAVALPFVVGVVGGVLNPPSQRGARELAATQAKVERGALPDGKAALLRWLREHGATATREERDEATLAWAKLVSAQVEGPVAAAKAASVAAKLKQEVASLPVSTRLAAGTSHLVGELLGWASVLAAVPEQESVDGALVLLTAAHELAPGPDVRRVEDELAKVKLTLADRLAASMPFEALGLYLDADSPEAFARATELVRELGPGPSLLLFYADDVQRWQLEAGVRPELAPLAAQIEGQLEEARALASSDARRKVFASGKRKALTAWLRKHPGDAEARLFLAEELAAKGKLKQALALVERAGGIERLPPSSRSTLAALHVRAGRLQSAEELLKPYVDAKLPGLVRSRTSADERFKAIQDPILQGLKIGAIPPELDALLYGRSKEEQQAAFNDWLMKKLRADAALQRYEADYQRHLDVVPAVLELAGVRERRAEKASGPERERLMGEADRLLAAVQPEVEEG